ncbi:cytochrome c [Roseovarius sp. A21]|uniref:Cytochrome c n=1 Tax=Roseovarius bejariae TaxID=2576383 RepID=A0A844CSN7_9RHOB|nr:cytochrome c [Roseovarius bejariae]MRU14246.1 cytochrome c [Roseovarius bejariae]
MKAVVFCGALAFLGISGAAMAETPGQADYERYCASCHGLEGTGHGPMRAVLTLAPADLSALSEVNGGVFPLERVVKRIDGRDPLVAHGSPMPVYGTFFDYGKGVTLEMPSGEKIMTTQPVADLVAYIKGLQGAAE